MADSALHTRPEVTNPTGDFMLAGDDGTQTALVKANNLPVPALVAEQLGGKADTTSMDTALNALAATVAAKQDPLTFVGATKVGTTVTIDPATVGGSLLDGRSWYALGGATGFNGVGQAVLNAGTSAYANVGTGAATNAWNARMRSRLTAAAATGNHARFYVIPYMRFASNSSALNGFKWACTYASADAMNETTGSGVMGFVGFTQHGSAPAIGTAPSAYSGTRFGFAYNPGDTNWKVYNDGTLVKDLGASFPCHGNETNPYLFEIESIGSASANRKTIWRITHLLTGATDTGTLDGSGPTNAFELNAIIVRDSNGSATQASFTTQGMACGAFYNLVVGERLDVPTPGRVTATGNLTKQLHANIDLFVKSATPVTLTVAASGFTDGDKIMGRNSGAGAVTFVGDGFTIEKHPDLPATVEQWQSFMLTYDAVDNVWAREA